MEAIIVANCMTMIHSAHSLSDSTRQRELIASLLYRPMPFTASSSLVVFPSFHSDSIPLSLKIIYSFPISSDDVSHERNAFLPPSSRLFVIVSYAGSAITLTIKTETRFLI